MAAKMVISPSTVALLLAFAGSDVLVRALREHTQEDPLPTSQPIFTGEFEKSGRYETCCGAGENLAKEE